MEKLAKVNERFNRILLYIGLCLLVAIVAAMTIQVISRLLLNNSQTWTEEFTRYCFIWMTMVGSVVCVRNGSHSSVSFLGDKLKGFQKKLDCVVIQLGIAGAGGLLFFQGLKITAATMRQTSPSLHIPMGLVYASTAVCGLGILINVGVNLLELLQRKKEAASVESEERE